MYIISASASGLRPSRSSFQIKSTSCALVIGKCTWVSRCRLCLCECATESIKCATFSSKKTNTSPTPKRTTMRAAFSRAERDRLRRRRNADLPQHPRRQPPPPRRNGRRLALSLFWERFGVFPRSGSDCTAIAAPKRLGEGGAQAFQNTHMRTTGRHTTQTQRRPLTLLSPALRERGLQEPARPGAPTPHSHAATPTPCGGTGPSASALRRRWSAQRHRAAARRARRRHALADDTSSVRAY